MKVTGPVNITSDDGVSIDGKTNNDILTAQGQTVLLNPDNEILNYSGEVHFKPTEIVFSSDVYNLTSDSNFVILIYDGPHISVNVTMDYKRGQTVYIINRINAASVITPYYILEGDKEGAKYFCSEQLSQWIGMGLFDYRES